MIVETAQVIGVEGRYALVRTERRAACDSCAVSTGCGTSVLSRVLGRRYTDLKVLNPCDAKVGDTVSIGVGEAGLLKSALVVYVAPLAGMMTSVALGTLIGGAPLPELAGIACGVAGFAGGLVVARCFSARVADNPDYHPVVLSVHRQAAVSDEGMLVP